MRSLTGCSIVTVAGVGGADRAGEDKDKGLALLRVYGSPLKPLALASENPEGDVTLVGVPDPQAQGGGSAVSAVKARVTETLGLDPAPAVGFDGGAAVDAQGRLAGIASLKIPLVAGAAPMPRSAQRDADAGRDRAEFPRGPERGARARLLASRRGGREGLGRAGDLREEVI